MFRFLIASFLALMIGITPAFSDNIEHRYTPADIWKNERDAKLLENWMGRPLRFMGEPSLWETFKKNQAAQIFRVTKFPSFTMPTVARVVIQNNSTATLYLFDPTVFRFEAIERKTEEDVLTIVKRRDISTIDQNQLQRIIGLFEASGIWANKIDPTERKDTKEKYFGLDGNAYLIETIFQGQYKIVWRNGCWMEEKIMVLINGFAKLSKSASLAERC